MRGRAQNMNERGMIFFLVKSSDLHVFISSIIGIKMSLDKLKKVLIAEDPPDQRLKLKTFI